MNRRSFFASVASLLAGGSLAKAAPAAKPLVTKTFTPIGPYNAFIPGRVTRNGVGSYTVNFVLNPKKFAVNKCVQCKPAEGK